MIDRNKSGLTHAVTKAASDWLDGHGFKPWETEVYVCPGWIADIAAAIVPTQTELINLRLLERKPSWDARRHGHDWTRSQYTKWHEAHRAFNRILTCIVEVKTMRSDFRGDQKWTLQPPADMAYLAYPVGVVHKEEWPDGWGILEYHSPARIVCRRAPTVRVADVHASFGLVFQIALNKDHSVRYAVFKRLAQDQRIEDNKHISRTRMTDAMRVCVEVLEGKSAGRFGEPNSVVNILERYRIKKVPRDLIVALTALWGKGKA